MVLASDGANIWLDRDKITTHQLDVEKVKNVIAESLKSTGYISAVFTAEDFQLGPANTDSAFQLYRNSFFSPRSPDIMGAPNEYVLVDDDVGGTGHGTGNDYDRHVPIVFMGRSIQPGKYEQVCGPEDIAPTIAKLFDVPYSIEEDARLLVEMLKN